MSFLISYFLNEQGGNIFFNKDGGQVISDKENLLNSYMI